jgi:allantoinase
MPLNSIPPTTTLEGLRAKEAAAVGKLSVDLGLWGGIIPTNLADLKELAAGGVCGFKCFMIESGVDEFPCVTTEQLEAAMTEVVKSCPSLPVLCHAEACAHDHSGHSHEKDAAPADERAYSTYMHSRPETFETDAITTAIRLSEKTGARTHVVHLSAAQGVPLFRDAKKRGLKQVSVETCPHYLTLDAESIPSGATAFKCAPPIRSKSNQSSLWAGLFDGTIPMIVSDHSPCEPSLKHLEEGDFGKAWGGISSLQLGLPLIFSELRSQALSSGESSSVFLPRILRQLHQWMSRATSEFVGFHHRKGAIRVGWDGDVTIWQPETPFLVEKSMIQHRHKVTPYLGRTLYGCVVKTVVRGRIVFENHLPESSPSSSSSGTSSGVTFLSPPIGERVRPGSHAVEVERQKGAMEAVQKAIEKAMQ